MEGISRRELARRAGISESAVRKHVDAGSLAGAVLRDGSLHPQLAMEALGQVVTRGKRAPVALTTARTRRLRAQTRRLVDEVAALRLRTLPFAAAEELLDEQRKHIGQHLRR